MFGGELLVPFAQRKGLRRLNEASDAFAILLKIHRVSPTWRPRP